tara:strand:- start:33 stop:257 length:225 start_codon:yes stop_codon:yes gene_type:complete
MVKQSDRQSVKVLLKENDRYELKRFIDVVWTEEDTPETCYIKLLKLYPEKKIYGPITIPDYGTDEEDWDKYYQD